MEQVVPTRLTHINPNFPRQSPDAVIQDENFYSFKSLKDTLFDAIADNDLSIIDSCIQEWQELCETADDCLYEAVILMNPLAEAVSTKQYVVVKHLVHNCGLRLKPIHSESCMCRLCVTLASDNRFLQLYIDIIVVSSASSGYVSCAHPESAIEIAIALRKYIQRYERGVGKNACTKVVGKCEKTIIKALNMATNEREAVALIQDLADDTLSPVEARLGHVLDFIDMGMKRAVEHPTTQAILEHEWNNGQSRYRGKMEALMNDGMLGTFVAGSFFYFVLIPLIIVFPHPKLVQYIEKPSVRFRTNAISFIFFFIIAVCSSMSTYLDIFLVCQRRHKSPRLYRISIWQGFLGMLIVAKIFRTASAIYFTGMRMIVGIYDILYMLSINFTVLGTSLVLISVFIVPERQDAKKACQSILKIPGIEQLSINCTATNNIYKTQPHALKHFAALSEPYVVGSVLVGCSFLVYLVSVGSFLYNFKTVALFAITVQELVYDVSKWALFFLFFMFGWCFAFKTLYSNFPCNNQYFKSISSTLTELFWVSFAMSGTSDYEIKISHRSWSVMMIETSGSVIYLSFFVVGTLILINLLIALMSVSYERLEDNKRQEVHYWRSKVMIKFILWNDSLPLPWNLFYPIYILNRALFKCVFSGRCKCSLLCSVAEDRIVRENKKQSKEDLILKDRAKSIFEKLVTQTSEDDAKEKYVVDRL